MNTDEFSRLLEQVKRVDFRRLYGHARGDNRAMHDIDVLEKLSRTVIKADHDLQQETH
jgi:hypothetical protein